LGNIVFRFNDLNGSLNQKKFMDAYNFLDKYQETEVTELTLAAKKLKGDMREEVSQVLLKYV